MDPQAEAQEVVDAYTASIRLRLYARLAFMLGVVGVVAVLGGMIVGWIGTEKGVAALAGAAVLATATAGKLYDQGHHPESVSAKFVESGGDANLAVSFNESGTYGSVCYPTDGTAVVPGALFTVTG
ncbi:MAG: hypothetical protein ACR2N7_02530 [Acidimicrobiia bacterium]